MKVITVLCRFPYPLNKGDKLRAFNQIEYLSEKDDIYLFCFSRRVPSEKDMETVKKYCKQIHVEKLSLWNMGLALLCSFFTLLPLQVALYTNRKAKKRFLSFYNKVKPEVCYFQFVRVAEYAKIVGGRKVLDFQDCLSLNMGRRSKEAGAILKVLLNFEARRLRKYEASMFEVFDAQTIITKTDRQAIESEKRDQIEIVENGVGESFIDYKASGEKKYELIFSGNMSYAPNVLACKFLVKEIMPLVWAKYPKTSLVLAGSDPVKEVRALASKNVEVTGWVEDMREYYAKARIFVAPMQIGTGLQNKLLEAMAIGLPCVSTTLVNSALGSENGKEILVADSREEIAEKILNLLQDKNLYNTIAENGKEFVLQNYSWSRSVLKLQKILRG